MRLSQLVAREANPQLGRQRTHVDLRSNGHCRRGVGHHGPAAGHLPRRRHDHRGRHLQRARLVRELRPDHPRGSYIGVESASVAAAKVADPTRNVPRATLLGTLASATVYLLSLVAIFGILSKRRPQRDDPTVRHGRRLPGPAWRVEPGRQLR